MNCPLAHENCILGGQPMHKPVSSPTLKTGSLAALILILSIGTLLRAWPSAGFQGVGYDEHQYSNYVGMAAEEGLRNYGRVVHIYTVAQAERPEAVVPPTRIGFLWPAVLLAKAGLTPFEALRAISLSAGIALLLLTATIAYRFAGAAQVLGFTTLIAVAPLQIYLAQRALIDGYFGFLAALCAWFLLECLRAPKAKGWLVAYGFGLFILVLTKENAAFVFLALLATAALLSLIRVDRISGPIVIVSVVAPALAVLVLASFLGGITEWISFYRMFVHKSAAIPYVLKFQDGAWYRYLVDFAVLSPAILALVFGRIFQLEKRSGIDLFWALFLGFSFVCMSTVPYGMSLRFAAFWDVPMRWLASSQLLCTANRIPGRVRPLLLIAAFLLLVTIDLSQYHRLFVKSRIYDPVSAQLLRASDLIK